ncbi:unnamed protein product [Gadus morhua 'NCC']
MKSGLTASRGGLRGVAWPEANTLKTATGTSVYVSPKKVAARKRRRRDKESSEKVCQMGAPDCKLEIYFREVGPVRWEESGYFLLDEKKTMVSKKGTCWR